MPKRDLTLSFDIGHASIGWAVFQLTHDKQPTPLGTGTVLFPKDSCLASTRRAFRRSRRNIAARRSRIKHLKSFLSSLGVLSKEELETNVNSYPWLLAARVLASNGKEKLSWLELYGVLRWYAHNRGYDGNALWAGDAIDPEDESEDTQKVQAARELMKECLTETMAETLCACLKIDPLGHKKASQIYFKGNNAAFPRNTVEKEVRAILSAHIGVLPKIDETLIQTLTQSVPESIRKAQKLPARFSEKGGLLFGQYIPRFDNRIIGKCRITGKNVPLKNCPDFFLYRWGRLMNNLTVFDETREIRTLRPNERKALHERMFAQGFFDKRSLNSALLEITGCDPANTESYFLTPEMEEALVLDPVKKLIARKTYIKDFWIYFSERGKKIFASELAKGKTLKLSECVEKMRAWGDWENEDKFSDAINALQKKEESKKPNKRRNLFNLRFQADFPSGRASYCREILRKTFEEALTETDSSEVDSCLYETEEIKKRLLDEPLSKQTNNHMVRHRLLIFSRLLADIIKEFADGDGERIGDVVIEVIKELNEFSGLTSKELVIKLNEKSENFSLVSKKIEADAFEANVPMTASLIRKARLLEDQNFTCPYTGKQIEYNDLFGGSLDIEHIIPRSLRPSDALSSCVMTYRAVNEMKGQRTAMQFMKECAGEKVPGLNIEIQTIKDFEEWIEKHKKQNLRKGFKNDDQARCRKRAELLLLEKYNPREADFTGRDLAQTSYLNKMAIRLVKNKLGIDARHLAGAITSFIRKNLNIAECLVDAVPRMKEAANVEGHDTRPLLKSEMRELSHLHHAMDAITQGLTGILFKTEDWSLFVKRTLSEQEQKQLSKKYPHLLKFSPGRKFEMKKLDKNLLKEITRRLEECRVVQHVPAKMHGMAVEQTTWGITSTDEETNRINLKQLTADLKGNRYEPSGKRLEKSGSEKRSLLLGSDVPEGTTSKLKAINGLIKISGNWGCALDPEPTVIPYFKVFPKLRKLRERNNGRPVRTLRNGMLIKVPKGKYQGVWRIKSIKDSTIGIILDLNAPDKIKIENKTLDSKINVLLKTLIKDELKVLNTPLTGIPCPTMSSSSKAQQQS